MAINISIDNKVGIKVKGSINDAAGIAKPFDFSLTCIRLDSDQIQAKLSGDSTDSVVDFLADVAEDWAGVRDSENKSVPYSTEALRALCKIPGVAGIAFRTYLNEVGAKEKN